jgi:hypothetical protein
MNIVEIAQACSNAFMIVFTTYLSVMWGRAERDLKLERVKADSNYRLWVKTERGLLNLMRPILEDGEDIEVPGTHPAMPTSQFQYLLALQKVKLWAERAKGE